ncbi:MAG: DUF2950 domain-containing protein [Gallionella sp.]
MNRIMNKTMIAALALSLAMILGFSPAVAAEAAAKSSAQLQTFYASPEAAAKALYEVVKTHDNRSIYKVLGPGSAQLIYTGDEVADQQMREHFLVRYEQSIKFESTGDTKAIILVGENESPFPFPLVKVTQGWYFDTRAGAEEMINRRIGENELSAIKFCLAYGDAQREYAEQDRNGDGMIEYAQKFMSSKGKRDGLYWPTVLGEPNSPLGLLAARAKREGYSAKGSGPEPFHGYYFKILTGQGKDAPGGAYAYIVKGHMIGGYALVAYPALWGTSGVMAFTCNHDGVVFEKNLGAHTDDLARKITRFNPDASWSKAQ